MTVPKLPSVLALLAAVVMITAFRGSSAEPTKAAPPPRVGQALFVEYLEIVTPDVDATCGLLEALHGVSFGSPDAALGNARTAVRKEGGTIGVRAPMHEGEHPVVRPYVLVDDVDTAIAAAAAAGAEIAVPSMEIPGHGTIGIYVLGGNQHGLWQR